MRHTIIEGPDGAGKTTLARCAVGRAYHHEGPPPPDVPALLHYGRRFAEAKTSTVFDRFHVGELVYGPLLRGKSRMSGYDVVLMNRLIRATGSDVVLCLPPYDVCRKGTCERRELITDEGTMRAAYDSWSCVPSTQLYPRYLSDPASCRIANLDVYDRTSGIPLTSIQPLAPTLPPGVIGSPTATTLVVGERPSGDLDLPFFSNTGCSPLLNESLWQAGYVEQDLAFTNVFPLPVLATEHGGVRDIAGLVRDIKTVQSVIVLGQDAWEGLGGLNGATRITAVRDDICLESLPHPSFWKRFHYHDREGYVQKFREARRVAQTVASAAR